jgi:hypothetical protein
MSTLVDLAISAHGGMDRRKRLSTVSAHLRVGGALWALTGKEGFMGDVNSKPSCTGSGRPSGPSSRLMGVPPSRPTASPSRPRAGRARRTP